MPQFEGTIREFTKFIGPYARLKVAFMAATHKRQVGKCEDCGIGEFLDAAHVRGKGRAFLIAHILSEFMEEDIIKMDLAEFEQKYIEAHHPIESTIRILCRKCHRQYDNQSKEPLAARPDKVKEESALIQELVQNQMNKSKAVHMVRQYLPAMTSSDTIFSNISLPDSWWLQTHNDKFRTTLHIILNDPKVRQLYIFKLPANSITNPSLRFKQRNDRYRINCSDIYIPVSGSKFIEKNGYDFTKFLVDEIKYEME